MTGIEVVLIVLLWLAFSLAAGLVANKKGHTFWGYFLISFLALGPLGLVMALLVARKPHWK
jgi:hypothetical protein